MPGLACDVGDGAVRKPRIFGLYRCGDDHSLPVTLKHGARLRITQIGAEPFAEARVAEHRLQLLTVIGLDRVEGGVGVKGISAGQREVERQRLASDLDVELVAARLGRSASIEHPKRT